MIYILIFLVHSKILKKLDDNGYVIDLLESFGISSTLTIEDLMDYKCHDFDLSNLLDDEPYYELISERLSLSPLSNISPNATHQVDNILDDGIITTTHGGFVNIWFDGKENHLLMIHR